MGKPKLTPEERVEIGRQRSAELRQLIDGAYGLMGRPMVWAAVMRAGGVHLDRGPINCIALAVQAPQATQVKGLRDWNKLGRRVIKDEKSLRIWGPRGGRSRDKADAQAVAEVDSTAGEAASTEPRQRSGWISNAVYDISQTHGDEVKPDVSAARPAQVVRNRLIAALSANGDHRAFLLNGVPAEAIDPEDAARALLLRCAVRHITAAGVLNLEQIEAEASSAAYVAAHILGLAPGQLLVPPTAGLLGSDPNRPPIRESAVRAITVGREIAASIGDGCSCAELRAVHAHAEV